VVTLIGLNIVATSSGSWEGPRRSTLSGSSNLELIALYYRAGTSVIPHALIVYQVIFNEFFAVQAIHSVATALTDSQVRDDVLVGFTAGG